MFTQPCFIRKNSKYLIDKLEELGYDYAENGAGAWFIPLCELRFLGVNLYSNGYYMGVNGVWGSDWIDCGTNEDLFLAIAALRDDTDKNQWFKSYLFDKFVKCNEDEFHDIIKLKDMSIDFKYIYHKATVKELIEHFK